MGKRYQRVSKIVLGGWNTMQPLLEDVFSEAIVKLKRLGMWEKLTASQLELLVSKTILEHYNKKNRQQKEAAAVYYSNSR